MQNTKTSKSLSAVIASATFAAMKLNATRSFEDILFLEMISRRDTLCYQLLSERINLVQIQQIEVQIRRVVSLPHAPTELSIGGVTPEIYYRDLISALAARYSESPRLSTLHALHFIVNDYNTIASRKLAMMGLAPKVIDRLIEEYNRDNLLSPSDSSPPRGSLALDLAPTPAPHPLSKFGVELTLLAQRGEIDPVVGRDGETQRVVEILSRRKKNNPILIGEAGVGKSAIIEGLALRIASGDVPDSIRGKRLFSLDISALVAGTKFRGEFEERMQQLLIALTSSRDAIVFIDEIHTIVGAGSTQGSLDTANILKPALARGEIQTIGATTLDEYRTHIEVDSALDRRFQRILVNPTSIEQSIEILQRIAPSYEEHHRVIYSDDALKACVTLSDRYIGDRHLPDKAIDIMDEAGARANISIPSGKQPVKVIERADIEAVITAVTGVPTERLCDDEITRLRDLEGYLARRVVGQRRAVEKLSRTIRRSRTGLRDEQRPIGVFMFVGPTGVGKTLLAKELSKWMFGEQSRNLIRIDMSEYGQSHNVARLIGSPPGYVGYGEGGELSEAVRRNPYSVVLFDEIEKAHPETFNLMLQIFDEGRLTDASGREVDFRNTIIIMTSNIGSRTALERVTPVGYATKESRTEQIKRGVDEHYRAALERHFAPEFLNRVDDVLLFRSLTQQDMERIIDIELGQILNRAESLGYNVRITPAARRALAQMGFQSKYGARALRRTLLERVEEPLAELIVGGEVDQGALVVIEKERGVGGVRLKIVAEKVSEVAIK